MAKVTQNWKIQPQNQIDRNQIDLEMTKNV
jgi:hypothetical protein